MGVPIHKLTNGFIAFDFADGPAVGAVRAAPKILQGGAKEMARSMTYRFGILNMAVGGASAGINAPADTRDEAIGAFVADAVELVAAGRVMLDPGKGMNDQALESLHSVDSRNNIRYSDVDGLAFRDHLTGVGAVAAATQAIGGDLSGKRVLIEATGGAMASAARAVSNAGGSIVGVATAKGAVSNAGGLDAAAIAEASLASGDGFVEGLGETAAASSIFGQEADVLLAGSKMGVIDHKVAEQLKVSVVAPLDAVPYTTKATIIAQRQGIAVLPDFVCTAGPTFADWPSGDAENAAVESAATDAITEITRNITGTERGPVLEACFWAESFITTWRDQAPFGRPFAA